MGGGSAGERAQIGGGVDVEGGEDCRVHRLHARGAGERAQQPVADAVHVVAMHAGEVADGLPRHEVDHADGALYVPALARAFHVGVDG